AHAHIAGARAILSGEGGDGVEAVEKEVRVDLHAEGVELGIASERARFDGALLGGTGGFGRERGVMQAGGEQEENRAERGEEGQVLYGLIEEAGGKRCQGSQQGARTRRGSCPGAANTGDGGELQRKNAAEIPRGKAHKREDQARGD